MKIAQIRKYDVANGPGIRTTIFVSGCTHNCKKCFNKEYQNFTFGESYDKEYEELIISYIKDKRVNGFSVLGGEPLQQDDSLYNLLKRVKEETNKTIWLWSGYTLEEIVKDTSKKKYLEYIDFLVDGRFEEDKKDFALKFRGSSNQRIIDVKETIKEKRIIIKEI